MSKLYLFVIGISFLIGSVYSQDMVSKKMSDVKEVGNSYVKNNAATPIPFVSDLVDPIGTIPVLTGYYDYVTNGNSLRQVDVFGDTVAVACVWTDSADAQISTARKIRYSVSYDGGASWTSDLLTVSPDGNAYPDMYPIFTTGRTVAIAGRQFATGGIRRGYVATDLLLGLGIFNSYLNPDPGADQFAWPLSGSNLACAYLSGDTICYINFDYSSNTYSGKKLLGIPPTQADVNGRQYIAASSDGNYVFVAWWISTASAQRLVGKESTDGGATFGSLITVMPDPYIFPNGDSVETWFGADILYKPGTHTKMMAYNTLFPGDFGTRRGSKLLFWSPGINSGNPVVIADWTKPNIPLLNDSLTFENYASLLQVGMTAVSHPSLAYTDDNSRLICAFSVEQPDTVYGYNFNDIYECYSDDNGATWSDPRNLTNTTNVDEIYVALAKTGNLPGNAGMTFCVSDCPGCTSFTNTETPICPVYQVYRRYDPVTGNLIPIGVKTISNEVPNSYVLHQNYPNPFNPSTKIKFDMPKNGYVTLKVYDMVGRLVRTLVNNEFVTAGEKEVTFADPKIASGIYFYRIETGDFTATRKMILVK